jgi:hypothetical protein
MMNKVVRHVAVIRFSLGLIVVLGALMLLSLAQSNSAAQEVDVEISELDCNGDPEMVTVTNRGTTPIDMTGWNLQSDPTTSESLALQQFGSLAAGETLTAQAGPSAEGPFVWTTTEVFRDNDASDFAQLASDAGEVLLKVNCQAAAQPTASPTASATPAAAAATASPAALAAAEAPTAGGPPAVATSITPFLLIAIGSGLSTLGLSSFALAFKGSPRSVSTLALPEPQAAALPAGGTAAASTTRRVTIGQSRGALLFVAVAILLAAAFLAFQLGGRKQK